LVAVTQELQWQAANGGLAFECRVKPSRVTNAYFFFGFTDVKTIEAPVTLSTATYTPNATNAVGFLFDTNATVVGWNLVGVAAGTEATHQALGTSYAPVADDFATYRIEVNSAGAAVFYINGLQVGTTLSGAVSPGVLTNGAVSNVPLTPIVAASSVDTAAAILVDIDYIHVSMNRAPDGDMT
jgi:hypothetical protein